MSTHRFYPSEAIAVINYQENLRREREANSLLGRLKRWFHRALAD